MTESYSKAEQDGLGEEDEGLLIECPLEVNTARINDLGLFDRKATPSPSQTFSPDRKQLLTEGRSLRSTLQSRLSLVKFGTHTAHPAVLLLLSVDFTPKSSQGVLRFRDAVISVQVGSGRGDEPQSAAVVKAGETGPPYILTWYPRYAEGPVKSTFEKFNLSIKGDALGMPGGPTLGPDIGYSMSRERPKRKIIHGTLEGAAERMVQWKLEENASAGDGIPSAMNLAVVVRTNSEEGFYVKLNIRAVTVAGIPVIGKDTGAVHFTPGATVGSSFVEPGWQKVLSKAISGKGMVIGAGERVFGGSEVEGEEERVADLAKVDLAALTKVEDMLKRS